MARLRYNNQSGALSADPGTSGTINFAVAPGFATIVAPDYIPITLDPGTGTFEIVWMTAFTSGATSGTVARGQEGTTGVAHPTGTWDHAPTVLDFGEMMTQVNATTSGAIAAAIGDIVNTTAAATVTLPAAPNVGSGVLVNRGNHTALITITANSGQSINGGSSGGSVSMNAGTSVLSQTNQINNLGEVLLVATSSTTWLTIATGTDLNQGAYLSGGVLIQSPVGAINALTIYGKSTGTGQLLSVTDYNGAPIFVCTLTNGCYSGSFGSGNSVFGPWIMLDGTCTPAAIGFPTASSNYNRLFGAIGTPTGINAISLGVPQTYDTWWDFTPGTGVEWTCTAGGTAPGTWIAGRRRARRVVAVTQSATPAINSDNMDVASITGLAQAITSMSSSLTGTPMDGDQLEIRITGTASRAITWGSKFVSSTAVLPTTTSGTTMITVFCEWVAALSAYRSYMVA